MILQASQTLSSRSAGLAEAAPVFIIAGAYLLLMILFFWVIPIRLWIAALASGAHVSLFELLGMRLRKIPPRLIVEPFIAAVSAGLNPTLQQLEKHHLAGGNVMAVVSALILAYKAGMDISFDEVATLDLAGQDVKKVIESRIRPAEPSEL